MNETLSAQLGLGRGHKDRSMSLVGNVKKLTLISENGGSNE